MKNFCSENKGTSIVGVIVALTMMLVMVAMFTQVSGLCRRMVERAEAAKDNTDSVLGAYYTDSESMTKVKTGTSITLRPSDGKSSENIGLDSAVYRYDYGDTGSIYAFGN